MKTLNKTELTNVHGGSAFTDPSQDQYVWVNGKWMLVSPVIFGS